MELDLDIRGLQIPMKDALFVGCFDRVGNHSLMLP